jgi:hypothetical protein
LTIRADSYRRYCRLKSGETLGCDTQNYRIAADRERWFWNGPDIKAQRRSCHSCVALQTAQGSDRVHAVGEALFERDLP